MTSTIAPATSSEILTSESPTSRRWLTAGVVAGLAGIGSIVASSMTGAVYEDDIAGDAVAITDRLSEMVPQILLFDTATMVSALLMVVFAAGLYRQLRGRARRRQPAPRRRLDRPGADLGGPDHGLGSHHRVRVRSRSAGLAGARDGRLLRPLARHHPVALGRGRPDRRLDGGRRAPRYGAYARWIGWTSAVLGGLALLFAVSPLQYMAGMVGPLWLTIATLGLTFSRHGRR